MNPCTAGGRLKLHQRRRAWSLITAMTTTLSSRRAPFDSLSRSFGLAFFVDLLHGDDNQRIFAEVQAAIAGVAASSVRGLVWPAKPDKDAATPAMAACTSAKMRWLSSP